MAVLGTGMHPWGKWGRPFLEYGVAAAREALRDAGLEWTDVQFVAGADTIRNGYPGFVSGASYARALGWSGASVASCYAACASGAQALDIARTRILAGLCDVALVIGAETAPKGFFKPVGGDRPDDPDWLRFRLLGATNPAYFALYARRRMALHGSTPADFAAVKVKNALAGSLNPMARYRRPVTAEEVLASPMVADPLRLMDICATSDGGAAVVLASQAYARRHATRFVRLTAVSTVTPVFPNTTLDLPDFATDPQATGSRATDPQATGSRAAAPVPERSFRASIAHAAYEEAGAGPEDLSLAEVYDLSTALELDWMEDLGLCPPGEAEKLLRDGHTALGGRIPVNPSGGLASFGEAIPAQALAQLCELTTQLRGRAGARQVTDARMGLAANQGLFGHGSALVATV
ncbi:lipid-transfer protein [Nonomuraea sp. NPDC050404]|uniref:lipid-transfer protein n=1 Tax=Nonomuraea sp. NPDC050404 TaxID=3155783 RepID=UPI0033D9C490